MASTTPKEDKKERGSKKSKVTEASLNMAELRELADLVNENGFTDFEFENEKIRVRLSKNVVAPPSTAIPVSQTAVSPPVMGIQETAPASSETINETNEEDDLIKITSPIVGTYYSAPAPDKPEFVSIGDKVSEETVVCIVEAMKLMNEIQAETSGEIVKVYVENAQPVEYGQPLFGIKQ